HGPFRVIGTAGRACVQIDGVPADPDRGRRLPARPAPGDSPDAGQQFVNAEWLGDVVVGAGVQRVDLVVAVRATGEHHDGYRSPGAQRADDLYAVHVRQAEVEHQKVGLFLGDRAQRLGTVGGGDHLVLAGGQVDPQRAEDLRFIVDDEDAGHVDAPAA